ncbi:hypothetical protein BsWGS_27432 [Bradybaena similaris]
MWQSTTLEDHYNICCTPTVHEISTLADKLSPHSAVTTNTNWTNFVCCVGFVFDEVLLGKKCQTCLPLLCCDFSVIFHIFYQCSNCLFLYKLRWQPEVVCDMNSIPGLVWLRSCVT